MSLFIYANPATKLEVREITGEKWLFIDNAPVGKLNPTAEGLEELIRRDQAFRAEAAAR